jgi:hypothetical protein
MKKNLSSNSTAVNMADGHASLDDVPAQLQAIEASCNYGDPLVDDARRKSQSVIDRVPSSIVDRVIALAARGGGSVAGITLDPDAAKQALADADQAEAIATSATMLARRAQDQAIRLRARVATQASAVRMSLRGYVKTEQGQPLVSENEELRSLAKRAVAARKARKTRVEKAVGSAAPPTTSAPPELLSAHATATKAR